MWSAKTFKDVPIWSHCFWFKFGRVCWRGRHHRRRRLAFSEPSVVRFKQSFYPKVVQKRMTNKEAKHAFGRREGRGRERRVLNCTTVVRLQGSVCGSVGRAAASDTRGPWFKSSHRRFFNKKNIYLPIVNCIEKTKIKKTRPGMAHFFKKTSENVRVYREHSHHWREV